MTITTEIDWEALEQAWADEYEESRRQFNGD